MQLPCRRRFVALSLYLVLALTCSAIWAAVPASQPGLSWYRGNTHGHSFWSDGGEFPEMIADWYKHHGYDFVALTDHSVLMEGERWRETKAAGKRKGISQAAIDRCRQRFGQDWVVMRGEGDKAAVKLKTLAEVRARVEQPGKFLMIQGQEINAPFKSPVMESQVHVNAINLVEPIPAFRGNSVAECIRGDVQAVAEQSKRLHRPMLAHVNHPGWKYFDISPEDLAEVTEATLFEVCNYNAGSNFLGTEDRAGQERLWDIANTLRLTQYKAAPLFGVASTDTHGYQLAQDAEAPQARAWVMVRAAKLDADSLVQAMLRGDFYATTGVILKDFAYDAKARKISVAVNPEPGAHYTIEFVGTPKKYDRTVREVQGTDKDGKPREMVKKYSADVGRVFSKVEGVQASYQLTGEELYVRAVIRSDVTHPYPPANCIQTKTAWCQPVGWKQQAK
jgi:hypothetical protein